MSCEYNFDGIVGPTHNYSGLSFGNTASMSHSKAQSNPKDAALQGLEKMMLLSRLGIRIGVLPPQERPYIPILKKLGFSGSDSDILQTLSQNDPALLSAVSSSASMWAANAATVCPSMDSFDQKVHFTPANLFSKFHRSFESETTSLVLKAIFSNQEYFIHHPPLPPSASFTDEGAANHVRLCKQHDLPGIQMFVFGRYAFDENKQKPHRFPARQTDAASKAIARMHRLDPKRVVFAQQNPEAIDTGVFHNDVISVGNENVFFYHELAFQETAKTIDALQKAYHQLAEDELCLIKVPNEKVPLSESVRTYLFNSQILTTAPGCMTLIAPTECQESPFVKKFLSELISDKISPIKQIVYVNVRQSMQNGGGPACLRLRVVLKPEEAMGINMHVLLTEPLYWTLKDWIIQHYRDRLSIKDLADPHLLYETRSALDSLTEILHLGSIYPFQR